MSARVERMRAERAVERLWARDHTLWKPDPTELTNRLGWLDAIGRIAPEVPRLREFAARVASEGYARAVLLGMGGSSLAPEVIHATFGRVRGALTLDVLDATDPAQVLAVERAAPLEHSLFVVASKSGTTIETLSQFAHFWSRIPDGAHFIAITDPGTPLERLARERGFRDVFLNPEDVGGRYAALTYFGLVPAALVGADLDALLASGLAMQQACSEADPAVNPGAWLGAVIGEAALAGRDQLTLVLPTAFSSLGAWLEQLIAESTGKEGRGVLPIDGEPLGRPEVYSQRRVFVALGGDTEVGARLDALAAAGHPVVRLPIDGVEDLGAEFFRWEFATAVAGHVLGIHPFDQPNVQEAKDATARILERGPTGPAEPSTQALADVLGTARRGDYLAILAYLPRTPEVDATLQRVRTAFRDRLGVATTVGYGPRYLHSTGQLHKGGPDNGIFVQVVGEDPEDVPVPGREFTFGQLKRAQALGDLESLLAHGRRVARATLDELEAAASS